MSALDKKLIETESVKHDNWLKLVTVLKHQFNEWTIDRLALEGYSDFKIAYMPVLMNITLEGINNNDLATHARVTKQAMSKVAKELLKLGYIKTKTDPRDKRSTIFTLTERGKKLVIRCRLRVKGVTDEYKKLLGQDFHQTTAALRKVIAYNDEILLTTKK